MNPKMLNKPQENNQNNILFSPREKDFFLTKIFKENQIDSSFLYKGNGGELFDKILKSWKYNWYNNEIQLIDSWKQHLQKFLGKNITDIWCGNWEKILHLLTNNQKNHTYIACDYSSSMIEIAEKNISENFPDIKLGNHQIMRPGNQLLTNNLWDNTYIWLGAEIGCHDQEETISFLKNMNNTGFLKWNNVIFSYFTKPYNKEQEAQQIEMYNNKESEVFVFNGLKNLGIDTSFCDYHIEYNQVTSTVEIGIKFIDNYDILLSNWEIIKKKKGEKIIVHKSKRFDQEEIDKLLKKSWLKRVWGRSENGVGLIVAKRKPQYRKKFNTILLWTSLALAWTIGWVIWYNISQEKEKQAILERNKEFAKKSLEDKTIKVWSHYVFDEKTDIDDKMHELELGTNNTYYFLCQIFHYIWDEYAEKIIKSAIRSELRKEDNLNLINIDIDQPWHYYTRFIKEILIPNQFEVLNNYIDITNLYQELKEHKTAFENTAKIEWKLSILYNKYWSWTSSNINRVPVENTSKNIESMLPWQQISNQIWESYNILTSDWLQAKIIGSFFCPRLNWNVEVLKITINKDWKDFDVLLFKDEKEAAWYEKYTLDQITAQDFLTTRWENK